MRGPGPFALAHAKLILFVVAVLAALGARSYVTAPRSMFPAMSFSRIDVVVDAGELPPEQVRVAVARPLEAAMQTLPSVTRVRTTASQGSAELIVAFDPATDPRNDLQLVNGAISRVRASIPDAKSFEAVVIAPNSEPVVSYALTSPVMSQTVLHEYAQTTILPSLYGTPGLGKILVAGGSETEFHVDLDPARLAALHVSAQDVASAISNANSVESVGTGVAHYERTIFLIDASLHDVASVGNIGIPLPNGSSLKLASLGSIHLGVAPATTAVSFDARHAVLINAYALPAADATRLAAELAQKLAPFTKLGPNLVMTKYWDQTSLVIASQESLRDAILIGAVLAVLVIFAFLGNLRMTLVAATIIPLAMAIAILILERSGQSLNLMSVGGLAVAVGLIIDDAIVGIEAITRRFSEDPHADRKTTIAEVVNVLARPMLASTLTTVVVFLPLALLSGVTGYFFRALAFTLATALLVSWLLAIFVTPTIAFLLLGRKRRVHTTATSGRIHDNYEPILRWALNHGKIVALGSGLVLAATVFFLARLPSDFLPSMNEGQFEIGYVMPVGLSLEATDAAATLMEKIIMRDADVDGEGRLTGIDTNGYSPTQPNSGTIRVRLRPGAQFEAVSNRLRDRLTSAVPAATLDFRQIIEDSINDLSGSPSPIEITLAGPSQSELISLAEDLSDRIGKVPGVVDAFDGVTYDDPAIEISPRDAQLASLGLQSTDVGAAVAARTQGIVATEIPQELRTVAVRVRVQGEGLGAEDAGAQRLFTKAGTPPLGAVSDVRPAVLASEVNDENGQRQVRVTANLGGVSLSSAIAGIRVQLAQMKLPPGYTVGIGGAYKAQQDSFRQFMVVFAVAVTLVYTVMLATFGSLRLPVVILAAIPLALIGVALGLFVTRTPLNVSSFMGILLLIGIVVKNGILLIDVAHRRRHAGDPVELALVAAGRERLRPIVMTTLAAIGGLLPLALGIGSGSEMQRPLAIAVIGGLSTATLFTLVVIPVLYRAVFSPRLRLRASTAALALMLPVPLTFSNLSLIDAERAAIAHSPEVAIAAGSLDAARAHLDQMRHTLGLTANATYSESPQGNSGGPQIASRITSTGAQVSVSDLLAHGPNVASAAANERSAQAGLANAQRLEQIKAIDLYFTALKARAIANARNAAVEQARTQLNAATSREKAGDAPRLDVVRAQVQLARARADRAQARANDANAGAALMLETNTDSLVLGNAAEVAPPAGVPNIEVAVAQAEATRSDVRSANEAVIAAQQAVTAAEREGIPPITLFTGYDQGADSGAPIHGPALTAQVSFPIPSTRNDTIATMRAQLAQAQARAHSVKRSVDLEVASAVRTLSAAIEAQRANLDALDAARVALEATQTGYRAGASSSLEVSTARSAYDQAVVDALSTAYNLAAARATLEATL